MSTPAILAHLEALPRAKALHAGGWQASCPAHEDRAPSLSWTTGDDGRVLVNCHAGCTPDAIVGALGLRMADLYPPKGNGTAKAPRPAVIASTEYHLRDRTGDEVAVHVRLDRADGTKTVFWKLPGASENGLDGRRVDSLPLYGSELVDGWDSDTGIVLVEGEKCAEALWDAGRNALATVTGAGDSKGVHAPSGEALAVLAGRRVTLWPDADDVGRAHMRLVAARLHGIAASVSWLEPPEGSPKGWDAADALAGVDDPTAALAALYARVGPVPADPTPPSDDTPRAHRLYTVRELAELPSADEEFLVGDGIMTRGAKVLIYGKSGAGKTTLLDDLVGAIATGRPWLGRHAIDKPRSVLVVQGELSLPEMASHAQHLVSTGVDTDRLRFVRMTDLRLPDGEDMLRAMVLEAEASVVALDPWYRLFSGESSNASEQVDTVFGVCDRLLDDELVEAVVVVHHANATGQRTAGSWIFEGWPSTIIKLEVIVGVPNYRMIAFEKIRAPGSSLAGQQLQVTPSDDGFVPIVHVDRQASAGELLALEVVRDAGGQLYRQELLERLRNKANVKDRAAAKYLGKAIQSGLLRSVRDGQQVVIQVVEGPPLETPA